MQAEDDAGQSATRVAEQNNDLKQHGIEKTYGQKIMLDTVQLEQQNKTNDPKNKEKKKHTSR